MSETTPISASATSITLSLDQSRCFDSIMRWFRDSSANRTPLKLGGLAGTGKTTLVSKLRVELALPPNRYVHYCAFTGKAVQQLRAKLDLATFPHDQCTTLHRFLYRPVVDEKTGRILSWQLSPLYTPGKRPALIIVDEASMVPRDIRGDLETLQTPIFYVGDHGQLPPIVKRGEPAFSLMSKPDLTLEKIHRQAADNPIIRLAHAVREKRWRDVESSSCGRVLIDQQRDIDRDLVDVLVDQLENSIILTDLNRKRVKLNQAFRNYLDLPADRPVPNDKLICLKNNYKTSPPIFNGQIGYVRKVLAVPEHWFAMTINMDASDDLFTGRVSRHFFNNPTGYWNFSPAGLTYRDIGDQFDYGYAITVHKAQGSESDFVVIAGNGACFRNDVARWAYTAVTRAKEKLVWYRNV